MQLLSSKGNAITRNSTQVFQVCLNNQNIFKHEAVHRLLLSDVDKDSICILSIVLYAFCNSTDRFAYRGLM